MEVVLGGISSLLYGFADFLGGEGAKRAPAAAIVLWAGVLSFPLILVVAYLVGGDAFDYATTEIRHSPDNEKAASLVYFYLSGKGRLV